MALRETLDAKSREATESLGFSLGLEGREKLNSFSFVPPKPPDFKISYKNLLGLKIPEIISGYQPGGESRAVTFIDTGQAIKETRDNFSAFLGLILHILPQELKLKRLGQEIRSTSRKVNSLEKYVIPQLRSQVKFIQEALHEREREDTFRLKRIKKKRLTKEGRR